MPQTCDEYITAFREGAELVLRGLEGRLSASDLDQASQERLREFLDDYQRLTEACVRARALGGDRPRASLAEFVRIAALN